MTYKTISKVPGQTPFLFSICSIITDHTEYDIMKTSFENCGFTENCEFIIADNSGGNSFNAYNAIGRFMHESKGKYLVIVHQDVRCIDSKSQLIDCLENLETIDNKWAVCGNAGAIGYHQFVHYLNNSGTIITNSPLPAQVTSLDENFLVLNNSANLSISSDIDGFHLYGTDLCIIADFLGYNCYVIPFMVKHLSLGNLKDLKKYSGKFIQQYGHKLRSRYIETTCTKFYLSNSILKNTLANSPFIFFLIKATQRIKLLSKRMTGKNPYKKTIRKE